MLCLVSVISARVAVYYLLHLAYHPWFVQEAVCGVEGVYARDATILEAEEQIPPVFICVADMLANQQEVRLKRSVREKIPDP